MKVILLNPPYKEKMIKEGRCEQKPDLFQTVYPPLELAYLAAILRKKSEVFVLDCIAEGYDKSSLITFYMSIKPDVVFVNVTTQTAKSDIKIIEELNSLFPCRFVVFGIYASYFRKSLSKRSYIKVPLDPKRYAYSLIGEKAKSNRLDMLPFPAWDLVNLDRYRLPLTGKKFVLLQTAVGCPYNCIFCTVPFYHGKKVFKRSIRSVIDEIEYLEKLGIRDILFFADNFTLDKKWVVSLCREIVKRRVRIRFFCNSRVDTVDEEILKWMRKAGCWLISLGIESGNQKILDMANKKITLEESRKAVDFAYKQGILTLGNFVIGLPGDSISTIGETISFAKSLKLDFAVFNIATPLPGSLLYYKFKGLKIDFEKLEYSSQALSSEIDLRKMQRDAYLSFYSRNNIRRLWRIFRTVGLGNLFNIIKSGIYLFFRVFA